MDVYFYDPTMHVPENVVGHALRLEELGYDGIAMPDHLYVPNFGTGTPNYYAHGLSVLAACAAVTRRVRLSTLVASNLARGPVDLAQAIATIDRISGGRAELGIGAGWFRPEYEDAGLPFPSGKDRIGRLIEAVTIIRSLLRSGEAELDGTYYRVRVEKGAFVPLERDIPIMVGAAAPRIIRAAAEIADRVDFQPDALQTGTVDFRQYNSYLLEHLRAGIQTVKEVGRAAGRDIPVSESPFVFVAPDAEAATAQRHQLAGDLGVDREVIDRTLGTIVGSPAEVAERLALYAQAGCDRVHVQALHWEAAERLAPHLGALKAL